MNWPLLLAFVAVLLLIAAPMAPSSSGRSTTRSSALTYALQVTKPRSPAAGGKISESTQTPR